MISREEKMLAWYVRPNFMGVKKTRVWKKKSCGIFLNEHSIAKSFADNTPCEEIVGTGCQLLLS